MEEKLEDKIIICKDTGESFVFTVGEQLFYKEKGFSDPVRSPEARKALKNSRMNRDRDRR